MKLLISSISVTYFLSISNSVKSYVLEDKWVYQMIGSRISCYFGGGVGSSETVRRGIIYRLESRWSLFLI